MVWNSVQTTNSWGLRGPEPDVQAPLRGIILGDSYVQGLLVGDEQTSGERLKRYLAEDEKTRREILNTGHLGDSPEQEYDTLREFADRFRPTFDVLSILGSSGLTYLDPIEAFADKSLRQDVATKRQGKDDSPNPLFNGRVADVHFSPLGC